MVKSNPQKVVYKNQCLDCGRPLNLTSTGMKKVKGGYICNDCSDTRWGDFLDENPIGTPRMHRGA